jgi:outer membrane protein TolC
MELKVKMKKNIFSIIILFISLCSISYSQNPVNINLTLNDAIKLALKNQPLIEKAEDEVKAAEAKVNEQKSFDYPDVEGNLSYNRLGPVSSIEFGGVGFLLYPANNYDADVSAKYTLYDFGKRNALFDLTKSFKLTSEEKINLVKDQLSYNVVHLFYSILYLEKSLSVKNDEINTLQQHLNVTQKKVNSGTATDFEVLTTQVRVASAKNEKVDIENTINKEKIALRDILGLTSDQQINLSGDFALMSQTTNADSLLDQAFTQREEIKIANDAGNSLALQKHAVSLNDLPKLNLMGGYGIKNGFMPNLDVLRGNWVLGISASIPIFNGFRKDAQVEEAEANLNANDAQISSLKRKIKTEVDQSISQFKTSQAQLSTTELQVEQAKQAVKRAEASYENGVITNLDLLDAETSLSEAELLHLRVVYQNVVNTYDLKEAVGDVIR